MQLFQGEEPTHDFLSLHTGGSSSPFQRGDNSLNNPCTLTAGAGYGLGVHNSLKLAKQRNGNGAAGNAAMTIDLASSGMEANSEDHVLPGGVGAFSVRQAPDAPLKGAGSHGIVRGAFAPVLHGSGIESTHETGPGSRPHRAPSIMWQDSCIDQRSIAPRAEGRSSTSSGDQGPSTPRSKHSATEQRRRTKINDRLEILRELLPHCDQKRDKASFLLEVIEYIRFLQEKAQKYESADPERNHEDSKSMAAWAKVHYSSCWRNTQNISQVQGGDLSASAQDMSREQCGSKRSTVAPAALFSIQSVRETSTTASSSHTATGTPQNWAKDSIPRNQPPWLSMSTTRQDSDSGNRMLSKHEKQTLHDDTRSLSSVYSQGLLNKLTEALKKSGVDTSQANISVEINMDRTARENTSDNSKVNEGEECIHKTKRLRRDKS